MFFLAFTRKKSKRRLKKRLCLLLAAALTLFAINRFESKISVFSSSYLPAFARQTTTDAVCRAVREVLDEGGFGYEDFVRVRYSGGKAAAVETDAAAINSFKSKVVAKAEEEC